MAARRKGDQFVAGMKPTMASVGGAPSAVSKASIRKPRSRQMSAVAPVASAPSGRPVPQHHRQGRRHGRPAAAPQRLGRECDKVRTGLGADEDAPPRTGGIMQRTDPEAGECGRTHRGRARKNKATHGGVRCRAEDKRAVRDGAGQGPQSGKAGGDQIGKQQIVQFHRIVRVGRPPSMICISTCRQPSGSGTTQAPAAVSQTAVSSCAEAVCETSATAPAPPAAWKAKRLPSQTASTASDASSKGWLISRRGRGRDRPGRN